MSYEFYKNLHYFGIFLLLLTFGAALFRSKVAEPRFKKTLSALHGVALFIILFAGFGLLARLGLVGTGWPTWVWAKIIIWAILGGMIALAHRAVLKAQWTGALILILATASAYFAINKPIF